MKDLAEIVDGLFKGLIFIFYSYIRSVFFIALKPVITSVYMTANVDRDKKRTLSPYVFMFLSFCFALILPRYARIIWRYLNEPYPNFSKSDAYLKFYDEAAHLLDEKVIFGYLFSCIILSIATDFTSFVFAFILCRNSNDTHRLKNALLYVSGFQILCISIVITHFAWTYKFFSLQDPFNYRDYNLVAAFSRQFVLANMFGFDASRIILPAGYALFLFLLSIWSLPVFFFFSLRAEKRFIPLSNLRKTAARYAALVKSPVLSLSFGASLFVSFEAGNFVTDRLDVQENRQLSLSDLDCLLTDGRVTCTVIVGNPTDDPWALSKRQMRISIEATADSTEIQDFADKIPRQKRVLLPRAYVERQSLNGAVVDGTGGKNKDVYLVEPGHSIWIEVVSSKSIAPFRVATTHEVHCTLSLDDAADSPITTSNFLKKADTQFPEITSYVFANEIR